ncbi:arsenite methyltransferase [Candidatus Nitrosotalea bavarica]|uniref:arsenite methyltransferase n=1 Tax=Candidatus Nitrosotalea bavarica TaxID=1903277 RepID=UPI000C71057D|nr:arsenite methyltransferase [Candidatus Nitrosotalea bavarica]
MSETIKEKVKARYGKIALTGNSDCCCMPGECSTNDSVIDATKIIGYDPKELESIPQESILGVGCGAPIKFADLKEGETVLDLGSGAGIDAFLSANKVSKSGKVIGIDMTDEMLEKARTNARNGNYTNVEFRKGDIEKNIPVDDDAIDAVISNCVINLTSDKTSAFKEIYRILRKGGRMVISDLVTDRELEQDQVNAEQWCSCIDGALTQEHYIESITKAGFHNISVLDQRVYMEGEKVNGRKITSLVIKAIK